MENDKNTPAKGKLSPVFDSALFFKMMFENAEFTAIIVMDPKGHILDANYGFKKCFGYTKEMLVGKEFSILFIEEDLEKNLPPRELKGTLEKGSFNDENYLVQADGTPTWVHGESIYIKDENGKEFVVKVIQDINEEKVLENELKRINEEQERVILDQETFVYTASHDLQSPINNIEGLVKALKENDSKDPGAILAMIDKSIERFRNKIRELSEIGREQEEARINAETVSVAESLDEVLLDLEGEIQYADAEIKSDISPDARVRLSKRNLSSILQNLISNSLKYREPSRNLKVAVESGKHNNDYVLVSVRDNGIGIAENNKDKIFRMYQRLHNDSKGTGVGMAIVKRIVDNVGGKVEVESTLGEGSTFNIYLPV